MREIFEKLSIKSTDYCAAINFNYVDFLSAVEKYAQGLVCAGPVDTKKYDSLKYVRKVTSAKDLEESAFDKVVIHPGGEQPRLEDLIRITDHFGMVLIQFVSRQKRKNIEARLDELGIFDRWWIDQKEGKYDLLFKVRKY